MTTTGSLPLRAAVAAAALAGIAFSVWFVAGCEKNTPTGAPLTPSPQAEIVGHTACKTGLASDRAAAAAPVLDCVEYRCGTVGVLLLTHVNAAFNCCIDDVAAGITIAGDTIRIVESEIVSIPCDCLCLYDIDYRISGLVPGTYTVVVVEPHTAGGDEILAATIDLIAAPTGTFCAPRDHYPWIEDATPAEPQGRVVEIRRCDERITDAAGTGAWSDMSCAEYRYAYGNVLSITHENAGFNCCAQEITADITVANGTITIVEHEDQSACDCSCLWDVSYEIVDIPPGRYEVRFVEPYRHPDDEPLQFAIDLTAGPATGVACAGRVHYPWQHEGTDSEDWHRLDLARAWIVDYVGEAPCDGGGDCRYIAFGAKPCGGPWSYLVYSTRNVDRATVASLVSWFNAYNAVLNRRYTLISDCSIPPTPDLECIAGRCRDLTVVPR